MAIKRCIPRRASLQFTSPLNVAWEKCWKRQASQSTGPKMEGDVTLATRFAAIGRLTEQSSRWIKSKCAMIIPEPWRKLLYLRMTVMRNALHMAPIRHRMPTRHCQVKKPGSLRSILPVAFNGNEQLKLLVFCLRKKDRFSKTFKVILRSPVTKRNDCVNVFEIFGLSKESGRMLLYIRPGSLV